MVSLWRTSATCRRINIRFVSSCNMRNRIIAEESSDKWVEITTEDAVHPLDTHPTTFPEIPIDLPDEPEDL